MEAQSLKKHIQQKAEELGFLAVGFAKAERKSMVPPGLSEVGPGEYGPFAAACEPQFESRKERN
jgi:hypothetical protein